MEIEAVRPASGYSLMMMICLIKVEVLNAWFHIIVVMLR